MLRKLLIIALFCATAGAQTAPTGISWQKIANTSGSVNYPTFVGYNQLRYNPYSNGNYGPGTLFWWANSSDNTIYSGTIRTFKPSSASAGTFPGVDYDNGTTMDDCTTLNPIKDRHPYGQTAIDTLRNRLWYFQGACGSTGGDPEDFGYWDLTTSPPTNHTIATTFLLPGSVNCKECEMVYDPQNDVLVALGSGSSGFFLQWVYCPSASLSGNQTSAGCVSPQTWASISPSPTPNAVFSTGYVYDTCDHVSVLFGGYNGGGSLNEIWTYTTTTQTWVQKTPSGIPAAGSNDAQPPISFDPDGCATLIHLDANADYAYVYSSGGNGTFSTLSTTGTGPARTGGSYSMSMAYDYGNHVLVAGNYGADVWIGTPSGGTFGQINLTVVPETPANITGPSYSNYPFSGGIPLPDSYAVTSTSALGCSGSSVCQFRSLGEWPDGNIKWVEFDGIDSITSGAPDTSVYLTSGGTGNVGTNIAVDSNSGSSSSGTITVTTNGCTYVYTKRPFAGTVSCSGSIVTSMAFVVSGPANPTTNCGVAPANDPCTTVYSTANDSTNCTLVLEENGPVKSVALGNCDLNDGASHVFMHSRFRIYNYYSTSQTKVVAQLENADTPTSTFNYAAKGLLYYGFSMGMATSGTMAYKFGGASSTKGGNCTGSNNCYVAQLYSNEMEFDENGDWNSSNLTASNPMTYIPRSSASCTDPWCYPDSGRSGEGYTISANGSSVETGTRSQFPGGWGDCAKSSGAGVLVTIPYMAANWPKSIEYNTGCAAIFVGLLPQAVYNAVGTYQYQAYPEHRIDTFWFEPHATAPSAPQTDALQAQYPLIASVTAGMTYYNAANIWPYNLPTATQENSFYSSVGGNVYPTVSSSDFSPLVDCDSYVYRYYIWNAGGGGYNQDEYSWGGLLSFLSHGFTGCFLNSQNFFLFASWKAWPRADGFTWRGESSIDKESATGYPCLSASNCGSTSIPNYADMYRNRVDEDAGEHDPLMGITDYYHLTGDGTVLDAINDGMLNRYLDTAAGLNVGSLYNSRAFGNAMKNLTRLARLEYETGDSTDAAAVQANQDVIVSNLLTPTFAAPLAMNWPAPFSASDSYTGEVPIDTGTTTNGWLTVQPTVQAITWEVTGANMSNYSDEVVLYGPVNVAANGIDGFWQSALLSSCSGSVPCRYWRAKIKNETPGQTATVTAVSGVQGFTSSSAEGLDHNRGYRYGCCGQLTTINQPPIPYDPSSGAPNRPSGAEANQEGHTIQGIWEEVFDRWGFNSNNATAETLEDDAFGMTHALFDEFAVCNSTQGYNSCSNPTWCYFGVAGCNSYGGSAPTIGPYDWAGSGFHSYLLPDACNDPGTAKCATPIGDTSNPQTSSSLEPAPWVAYAYLAQFTGQNPTTGATWGSNWQPHMQLMMAGTAVDNGAVGNNHDIGGYNTALAINFLSNVPTLVLQNVPLDSFTDNGDTTYTIKYTTPSGSTRTRIKWGDEPLISPLANLGYNPMTCVPTTVLSACFTTDPTSHETWWGATAVGGEPTPTPGVQQTVTFTADASGKSSNEVSVEVYAPASTPPSSTGTTVSGGVKLSGGVKIQ